MLTRLGSRRSASVVVLLAAALALTGCGGKDATNAGSTPKASPTKATECGHPAGAASNAVSVTGDFGKQVKVSVKQPVTATSIQRTVLTTGHGDLTQDGDNISVMTTLVNAKDGKQIDHNGGSIVVGASTLQESLKAAIECVPIGSRVVTTFPAKDLFGDTGNAAQGIAPNDSLAIVVDVLEKAKTTQAESWDDAPTVTFHGRQSPSVTLTGDAPSDLKLHVIKAGDGAVVASGDNVTLDYKGLVWRTGKVFDQSYGKGGAPRTFSTNGVIPGFAAALVGQRTGTQLIVSIPPSLGYGAAGLSAAGINGTDTLVFIVEIAATAAADATAPTP